MSILTVPSPGLVAIGVFGLVLAGCSTPSGPDLSPIGNGLVVIGLSIVLAALIRLLGRRRESDDEKP